MSLVELMRLDLSGMDEGQRVGMIVGELVKVRDIALIATVRNEITEHLNDLIAERYADQVLGEVAA